MSSQPIMVPANERSHQQLESHSISIGHSSETTKSSTPPNVSRSLSNRKFIYNYILSHRKSIFIIFLAMKIFRSIFYCS